MNKVYLRGFSQVFLQNDGRAGFIILLSIALRSPVGALLACAAVMLGTWFARLIHADKDDIESGLYGCNPALVGIAIVELLGVDQYTPLILVLAVMLSTGVSWSMLRLKLPALTFPFVLTTWSLVSAFRGGSNPYLWTFSTGIDLFDAIILSLAEVMLQGGNIVAGVGFLVAICLVKPSGQILMFAIVGALIAIATGAILEVPMDELSTGVIGFNAVLTSIALSQFPLRWLAVGVGSLTATLLMVSFPGNLPALTMPFVATTWAFQALRSLTTQPETE